jgi:prepilin-type N-terminal cleavage/methylation domain-containing protein
MFNPLKQELIRLTLNEKGFTLIELFTAIVLLTIGLLGTAALTAGVIRGNVAGKNLTTATAIAQSCLQENRRVGYTNAGTTGCTAGTTNVSVNAMTFSRTLSITPATNEKTLTVTVTWSEGSVGSKSVTLSTVIVSGT